MGNLKGRHGDKDKKWDGSWENADKMLRVGKIMTIYGEDVGKRLISTHNVQTFSLSHTKKGAPSALCVCPLCKHEPSREQVVSLTDFMGMWRKANFSISGSGRL